MSKMTDKDIIKGLECCAKEIKNPFEDENLCFSCPYAQKPCSQLYQDALDLINRQQAEIERLQYQVNRLKKYDEKRDIELHSRLIATARAEAIKEFAEQVKMAFYYEFDELIPSIMADKIDNLVKEMVGDDK